MKFKAVGGVVGRAHDLDIHPREDAPRGEVARGKLPIGLLPDAVGRGGLEQFIDAGATFFIYGASGPEWPLDGLKTLLDWRAGR